MATREASAFVTVLMFASARESAGVGTVEVAPGSVEEICSQLSARFSSKFTRVLAVSTLVCEGARLDHSSDRRIEAGQTIDVLPPFAGG